MRQSHIIIVINNYSSFLTYDVNFNFLFRQVVLFYITGSKFFLVQNFLNQFNFEFPLFQIVITNIKQRKIEIELV